jgi:hypothetical protein
MIGVRATGSPPRNPIRGTIHAESGYSMRVLAAKFPDRSRASDVLNRLYRMPGISPPDVAIAPLGIPGKMTNNETLLAGRFADERTDEVAKLVREAGGEIVADVDERWTRPRSRHSGAPTDAQSPH